MPHPYQAFILPFQIIDATKCLFIKRVPIDTFFKKVVNRVSLWDDTKALEMKIIFFILMFPLEVKCLLLLVVVGWGGGKEVRESVYTLVWKVLGTEDYSFSPLNPDQGFLLFSSWVGEL